MNSNSNVTKHARKRMQQRAIKQLQIDLIESFGTSVDQKGNSEYAFVPTETIAALRAAIDRLGGVRLVRRAGLIITAMHETRRLRGA